MNYYRLYFFDGSGRIEHVREFEASDDVHAIWQAGEWRGSAQMELWSGARKIKFWEQRQVWSSFGITSPDRDGQSSNL
jgi:hypothetical protein